MADASARHDRGGGHDHGHAHHDHAAGAGARRIAAALAITLAVLGAEAAGAWAFGSLALLSDAGHMVSDAAALAIALAALKVARRPADGRRTYGYRRLEILAAAFNAVMLFVVAGVVLVEGVRRLLHPAPVASLGMLAVAGLALLANLAAMAVLASGRGESMTVRGAYLEVWADAVGSIGVILGAVAIRLTGAAWIDPLVGIGIALWVLPRAWILLRDTAQVLLEGVPARLSLAEVRGALVRADGVAGVHDLHLWSVAGDDASLTAHVELARGASAEAVRVRLTKLLADRFAVRHVTLQCEAGPCTVGHVHP